MLVYAFGVQRDSVITVKFNEAVDVSSVIDTSNWRLNLGLKVDIGNSVDLIEMKNKNYTITLGADFLLMFLLTIMDS